MNDVLVLYASTHGHTARIATRMALQMRHAGATVDLQCVDSEVDLRPTDYDVVIVGASIHAGRHQREIVDWARRHATTLSSMPSAFFSVSLTAADGSEEATATVRRLVDEFVEQTGWTPRVTSSVAGALQYREYNFYTRLLIKLMMHRGGRPTDSSRDYDFTDWDAVDAFAAECVSMISVAVAA